MPVLPAAAPIALKTAPDFSLIVPAFNEETLLPRLLASVEAARACWRHGPDSIEVIVADNASTDRTAEIAAALGCRVAPVERRVIAAARNGGAAIARGRILCFTDADGQIHPRTFEAIAVAVESGKVVAGATGVTFERWSAGLAATYAIFVPFLWFTQMDTGVVFCRREDFAAVGGYDETRPFGEDVALLLALRRRGLRDGRRLRRLRGVKTIASTRKFEEHGDWHYFTQMLPLAWRLLARRSTMNDFARRYWYPGER